MANFNLGETVICSCVVKDSTGTLKDPATSMKIEIDKVTSAGTVMQIVIAETAMTKDSTGTYHYDFTATTSGVGNYRAKYVATDGTRITISNDSFSLI